MLEHISVIIEDLMNVIKSDSIDSDTKLAVKNDLLDVRDEINQMINKYDTPTGTNIAKDLSKT